MDFSTDPKLGATRSTRRREEEGDPSVLSRLLLGTADGDRIEVRMDLLATSWLGVLIAAVADHRVGLAFLLVGFALTAVSARLDPVGASTH